MKKKQSRLNDGYAQIYSVLPQKTNFNADISPKKQDDMKLLMEMAYQEQYKRDQDYEFAESSRHSLNLKVKMRLCEEIKKTHKIVIDDVIYNAFKIDYSKSERSMYLYLEEERKIAK